MSILTPEDRQRVLDLLVVATTCFVGLMVVVIPVAFILGLAWRIFVTMGGI